MTNLVTNGAFETNVNNWTTLSSTKTRDTTEFHGGAASMKMVATAAPNSGAYATIIMGASSYRIIAWLKGQNGAVIRVGFYAGSSFIAGCYTDVTISSSAWTKAQLDCVPGGNAYLMMATVSGLAVGQAYYADDLNVDLTPVVSGGGSLIRSGAKKPLTITMIRSGAKKTITDGLVRAGAKKTLS